jgi:predicted nucleic acid-binding protein
MAAGFAYFDTSVLVKRYVREAGSKRARELLRQYRFLSSTIVALEALSALTRRVAIGDLSERDFAAIVAKLRADRNHWELIELSGAILSRAEGTIGRTRVRTLDALHIASAQAFEELSGLRIPFVTADERQRDGASLVSLPVTWVASA